MALFTSEDIVPSNGQFSKILIRCFGMFVSGIVFFGLFILYWIFLIYYWLNK